MHTTRPVPLYQPAPAKSAPVSLVDLLLKPLEYAKYTLAGAIGGMAVVHTTAIVLGRAGSVSDLAEVLASIVGGLLLVGVAKVSKTI